AGVRGVRKAVVNVVAALADALNGIDATDQRAVDRALIAADGTPEKSRLRAEAAPGAWVGGGPAPPGPPGARCGRRRCRGPAPPRPPGSCRSIAISPRDRSIRYPSR